MSVEVAAVASELPDQVVMSWEVEQRIAAHSPNLKLVPDIVRRMTGIESRRRSDDGINTSDLAAAAGRKVLEQTGTAPCAVDLLIFASASQDLIEPATAHIVQHKLGTQAAAMDIKNACNSFLNGLQVAEALISTGQYSTALVVVGEIPSRAIKWSVDNYNDFRLSFPGYTLGDAGAAVMLRSRSDRAGIFYRRFWSASNYWDLGGLLGGGSMHWGDNGYDYFRGDGVELSQAFIDIGPEFLFEALRESDTTYQDFARIFIHQATMDYLDLFVRTARIPRERVGVTLPTYGNMVSATLPVGIDLAVRQGEIRRGDRVLLVGLAGGVSLGVVMFEY